MNLLGLKFEGTTEWSCAGQRPSFDRAKFGEALTEDPTGLITFLWLVFAVVCSQKINSPSASQSALLIVNLPLSILHFFPLYFFEFQHFHLECESS